MTADLNNPRGAEHESLEAFIKASLSDQELQRVLFVSFNHWDFTLGAIAEIAATLHDLGTSPMVALWADETPLKDVGWTTSRGVGRLFGSAGRDRRLKEALRQGGMPAEAFPRPPIASWKPIAAVPQVERPVRSQIRQLIYRGSSLGRALLQVMPNRDTPVTDAHEWSRAWIRQSAKSYAWAYDQVAALIEAEQATAVIVYNGRFLHDSAAANAAAAAQLPVLAYDMGGNETDFDLTADATHDWAALQVRMRDMYEHWPSPERERIGSSWFAGRFDHVDPRNHHFTDAQDVGQGIETSGIEKLVVFFSSSGDEIAELDIDWTAYFDGQPQALAALAQVCREQGCTLLVRSHPHKRRKPRLDVDDWLAAVADAAPDIHLDPFSPIDSYTLIRQADVVVTYGSTTGVEAAFAGRPVVIMGPSAYDELGCAVRVRTEAELREAIAEPVPGDPAGAMAYGLMMQRRGFVYSRVSKSDDGIRSLNGVAIQEPHQRVMKVSDVLKKLEQWRYTRD